MRVLRVSAVGALKSRNLIVGTGRHRFIGFATALVLGSLVALTLFEIMEWLVRVPTSSQRSNPPAAIFFVSLSVPSRPEQRAHPPRSSPKTPSRAGTLQTSMGLQAPRPAHRISRRSLALDFVFLPDLSSANTEPAVSRKRTYIDWQRSLKDYFRQQDNKPAPFGTRVLPPRPPSAPDLPTRMRFPNGVEVDRIGNTCYAVAADEPRNYPPGANTMQFQNWLAMRALFAHKIPCLPGSQHSFAQDFLDRLRERGYPKKPPGR